VSALYAWLGRHPRLVDAVLAAPLAFAGLVQAVVFTRYLLIPVTIVLTVAIIVRRSHPTEAFATAIGVGAVQVILGINPSPTDLAILVLLYTLAAYTTRRKSVLGLAACLIGSAVETVALRSVSVEASLVQRMMVGTGLFAGPALIAWVLGDSMRYRRAYYANLEERAARLERDRDAQAEIAAAAERARIARELHDVIAHNVSVMVVQADGAGYALGTDPGRVREALAAISATGRQALTEMRALLGVLRRTDGAGEVTLAPMPGLSELDELLDQTRAAGLPVSCTIEGIPQLIPDGTALTAYRIVQESLTNARKHAGAQARADVYVRYGGDGVQITVTDDGLGPAAACDGQGHGLAGMSERAAMHGGSVHAGPRAEGGFQVTAWLPVAAVRAGAA
jgi:signal transduction histidine kinase